MNIVRRDIGRATAITGIGDSPWIGKNDQKHDSWIGSAKKSALAALADAGLAIGDVDGVLCWGENHWSLGPRRYSEIAEVLGIRDMGFGASVATGGVSPCLSIWLARWAVATGRCRNVLICNGGGFDPEAEQAFDGGRLGAFLAQIPHHSLTYEQPFGPMITTYYAASAMRHMYEFGTTSAQLAEVAVALRHHASLNPDAVFRNRITVDDVLSSRLVCSPLHLLDCGGGVRGSGGGAMIVSSAAQARDTRKRPIWILGAGLAQSAYFMGSLCRGGDGYGLTRTVGSKAGATAFGEAGVKPADIDTAQFHDNFTYTVLVHLEDSGFCKKGEGGPFVSGGALGPGRKLPTNTDGGHLNHGGALLARQIEAVRQLRHEARGYQVKDAKLAFTASTAGVASTFSTTIFARD
jgi:acetyl-CoA acetyltransferase